MLSTSRTVMPAVLIAATFSVFAIYAVYGKGEPDSSLLITDTAYVVTVG